MPRPTRPWFRFYVEMPRDPKIRRLAPAHRWVWACVLCAARESPIAGYLLISEREPLSVADLADLAAVKEPEVRKALDSMEHLGLIERDENLDCLFVPKFTARQYESDDVTARTRKHRERSKDVQTNDVGTFQHRSREQLRNTPETETETEEESNDSSKPRSKRGMRIPPDWKPSPDEIDWQREQGIADDLARRELPRFLDYWTAAPGQKGVKLDWPATWRNWLRTAVDNAASRERPSGPSRAEIERAAADPLWAARQR